MTINQLKMLIDRAGCSVQKGTFGTGINAMPTWEIRHPEFAGCVWTVYDFLEYDEKVDALKACCVQAEKRYGISILT